MEQIHLLFPMHLTYPDSLLVLLDVIRTENEHRMTYNEKVRFYNLRGVTHRTLHHLTAAKADMFTALQYLEKLNDGDLARQARIIRNIAGTHIQTGNLQEAVNLLRQARTLLDHHSEEAEELYSLYMDKGAAFSAMGETDSAVYYIQRAINIVVEENILREGEAIALINLAILFNHMSKFSQAEENLRRAAYILQDFDNQRSLWATYVNLSQTLIFQERINEALYYAQKSNEIAVNIGLPQVATAGYYYHRGNIYLNENNYRHALEKFYRALELTMTAQNVGMIATIQNSIAQAYIRLGDINQATHYANLALQAAQENNIPLLEAKVQRTLADIYAARGDIQAVMAAVATERTLRDRLFAEQSNRALHEMQVRYETELMQVQLAQKEEIIKHERAQRTLISIISVFIIFFFILIVFLQRRRVQNAKRLVQQYETILKLKKVETRRASSLQEPKTENVKKDLIVSEMSAKLMPEIERLFNEEKIYKRQGLTMDDVAKMLNTNRQYLSIVFNEGYQTKFPEFVKTFRIDAAIEMFKESHKSKKYAHYTLQAIAEEVGFIGKNSFSTAFKEITGVTPTEYLKTLKAAGDKK